MDLGPFNDFNDELVNIGKHLLTKDPNNPYANYYLASFYDKTGDKSQEAIHFNRIVNAANFSRNWYTMEAQQWLDTYQQNENK